MADLPRFRNKFVISAGSYGGVYAPVIASVIHEENKVLAQGEGKPGTVHINLDSIMLSNSISVRTFYQVLQVTWG
jgi:carboxypeptidase C (cathepsin A)